MDQKETKYVMLIFLFKFCVRNFVLKSEHCLLRL